MKNNRGMALTTLIIVIIILGIIFYIGYKITFREDGLVEKVTTEEQNYNKNEVLEELNNIITEKYLNSYKKAMDSESKDINQYYNSEIIIKYLKGYSGVESGTDYSVQDSKIIIEDLVGGIDEYFINISELKRNINTYGKGENIENSKDFFFIRKEGENLYKVYYKNSNGEDEELGNLQIEQNI